MLAAITDRPVVKRNDLKDDCHEHISDLVTPEAYRVATIQGRQARAG